MTQHAHESSTTMTSTENKWINKILKRLILSSRDNAVRHSKHFHNQIQSIRVAGCFILVM